MKIVYEENETIQSISEWHKQTFPDATLEGQIKKFNEERDEYKQTPTFFELADMFIVACGISRFDSILALDYFKEVHKKLQRKKWLYFNAKDLFIEIINIKMNTNRRRQWNKVGGLYKHKGA